MAVTPEAVTPAIPNDPIHARERKYGIQRNAAYNSESASPLVHDDAAKFFVVAHRIGGKTPAQGAQGLGGGAYASGQVGERTA
jgi:hypothetical protein